MNKTDIVILTWIMNMLRFLADQIAALIAAWSDKDA